MRKYFIVGVLALTAACSKSSPLGPSSASFPLAQGSTVTSGGAGTAHTHTLAPVGATENCDAPEFNSVVFDQKAFGHVTVHNNSRCTNDFLFAIWDAGNYDDQTLISWVSNRIPPGGTMEMTLGIPNPTCTKYQRDVYFGISKPTADNMHNFFVEWSAPNDINVFYANGDPNFQPGGICEPGTPTIPPPPPPPPATCQNREANNFGGLLPCTFGEGVIIVEDPPPSVVVDACTNLEGVQDGLPQGYYFASAGICLPVVGPPPPAPQKFLFCHVDVNITGGREPKTIVHETQVGGLNGIPLSSIQAAHNASPFHGVTTEHFYDYYGVCDGRGINQQ